MEMDSLPPQWQTMHRFRPFSLFIQPSLVKFSAAQACPFREMARRTRERQQPASLQTKVVPVSSPPPLGPSRIVDKTLFEIAQRDTL